MDFRKSKMAAISPGGEWVIFVFWNTYFICIENIASLSADTCITALYDCSNIKNKY